MWEFGGLWNENVWRRKPDIQRLEVCLLEQGEKLWLYRVEDDVLMVEVRPTSAVSSDSAAKTIGQVVLKRLITAEDVIERLSSAGSISPLEEPQASTDNQKVDVD